MLTVTDSVHCGNLPAQSAGQARYWSARVMVCLGGAWGLDCAGGNDVDAVRGTGRKAEFTIRCWFFRFPRIGNRCAQSYAAAPAIGRAMGIVDYAAYGH